MYVPILDDIDSFILQRWIVCVSPLDSNVCPHLHTSSFRIIFIIELFPEPGVPMTNTFTQFSEKKKYINTLQN